MKSTQINDGFLILDKPLGLTSRQLVDRIKPYTSKKVGHTGTLDPLATGMMVLAIGDATKFSQWVISQDKAYTATIQFGTQTETDDSEGNVIYSSDITPDLKTIQKIIKSFMGDIQQIPPQYSAIHVNGKRAYKLARQNIQADLKPRPITIHNIEIKNYNPTTRELTLYIHRQSGTYIRSIARDLGQALNCYAHLSQLKRLWISPFENETLWTLEDLPKPTISLDAFFKEDAYLLTHQQALDLSHGKTIELNASKVLIAYYKDTFLGIIEPNNGRYKSLKLRSDILSLLNLNSKNNL